MQLTPLLVGWHFGNFHWNAGASVFLPVGSYEFNRVANTSRNYWSAAMHGGLTYLDPATGWDLSACAAFVVDGENAATHYRPGHVVEVDFAVGKNLTPEFRWGRWAPSCSR